MDDIGNNAHGSLSTQVLREDRCGSEDSGIFNDPITFNPVMIAQNGAVPYSVITSKEGRSGCESVANGNKTMISGTAEPHIQLPTLFPAICSSKTEEGSGNHTLYVQLGEKTSISDPSFATVPSPIEPEVWGEGPVHRVSASFPTVPSAIEPDVEAHDPQHAGFPSHLMEMGEEISGPLDVSRDGNTNSTSWLRTPRGKAVVRRGRPRPWTSESREAARKRVKLDELYDDASPSMDLKLQELLDSPPRSSDLENPFSQEGAGRFLSADEAHETTILAPELLAQLGGGDLSTKTPSSVACDSEKMQTPSSSKSAGNGQSEKLDTTSKPIERNSSMSRCGGITLQGNQCTHNVKDGSGFCVKHTKSDADPHQRADHAILNCESTGIPSSRGATNLPSKPADIILFRCRGRTLHGHQCTHNVKDGALYCLKHADQAWGTPVKRLEEKISQELPKLVVPNGSGPAQPQVQTPNGIETSATSTSFKEKAESPAGPRCIGRTRRTEDQCSFRPKPGSVFCERHSRQFREQGSLDYNVTSEVPVSDSPTASATLKRRTSQEGLIIADKNSIREKKSQSRANELFKDVLNAGLLHGQAVSTDRKDLVGWICEEATKDAASGETLLGLLSEEKERLRKLLIEDNQSSIKVKPALSWGTRCVPDTTKTFVEGTINLPKHIPLVEDEDGRESLVNSSTSPSSNIAATSGSATICTQMSRQGSEADRDILTCALCNTKFSEMMVLGNHWKEEHKKEAFLFQKGVACRECAQEYTNRGGLLRHWKSTHASLPVIDPGTVVCVMCDKKFDDFNKLWKHVEDQHSLEFSRGDFARQVREGILGARTMMKCSFCVEEFDTLWDLQHHKEISHKGELDLELNTINVELPNVDSRVKATSNGNGASPCKFKCRYCGERFNLLPDLGRHHQAEHRKPNVTPLLKGPLFPAKASPVEKRPLLPNPETADSPPGKMLPLSELCTSLPHRLVVRDKEDSKIDEVAVEKVMIVQQPQAGSTPQPVVVGAHPQVVNFRQWKTIAREKGKKVTPPLLPVAPIVSVAPKRRRRRRKRMEVLQSEKLVSIKKKYGGAKQIVEHMKAVKQIQQERHGLSGGGDGLIDPKNGVTSALKMLPHRISNTTGWPTSAELLRAARIACCKDSLYGELAKKHEYLHPNLHLQAVSLCVAMSVEIQWHMDGFVCPNKCPPFQAKEVLVPALEVDMAGFSGPPFLAQTDLVNNLGSTSLETVDIKDVIKGKCIVMYEDISNGQEPVPVPCVIDEDVLRCTCASCRESPGNPSLDNAELWKSFSYINKRLLDPSLGLDTESSKLGCACGDSRCNPIQCEHVLMFDTDNVEARDKSGVAMKGRFPYDEQGRIILEEGYMVYECNSSCLCQGNCQNRVLQKGVRVKLEVFKSRHKGWAVRTAEPIACGTFVCEYIGEVLNDREANKRGERYDIDGCSYLYDIDAHLDVTGSRAGAKPFVIDATNYGNVARFINHSCAPNLVNYEVLVESMDCQLAHIGFFAKRDIAMGEELAYNYRYKLLPGKGCVCHCGASTCRGRLY